MDAHALINSRLGVGFALYAGRLLPPQSGYKLADFLARQITAHKDWSLVRAVRMNQWVISQGECTSAELDEAVLQVFRNTGHALYDFNHNLLTPLESQSLVELTPFIQERIERAREDKSGFVLVGIHLGNFEFAMHTAFRLGLRAYVLTLPELPGGLRWQYELRQKIGFEIIPVSLSSMRQAANRLEQGGIVLTGIDRPVANPNYKPRFFGRPASLPVHHVILALKARVPVILAAIIREPDGMFHFHVSDPIEMQHYPERATEILRNAEAVLEVAEVLIRQAPQQWAIFYPVWPEVQDQIV
jgi:lauroyl/myristoyl acyltransferase